VIKKVIEYKGLPAYNNRVECMQLCGREADRRSAQAWYVLVDGVDVPFKH